MIVKLKAKKQTTIDVKQSFLSSAISDISTYIQMADTKVSIIIAAVVAILVGAFTCHEFIYNAIYNVIVTLKEIYYE
jgi:hypothetical protein